MLVPIHVTDAMRPLDDDVSYPPAPAAPGPVAAAEGIAATSNEVGRGRAPHAHSADEIARHRHRKAHGGGVMSLTRRRRARPAA